MTTKAENETVFHIEMLGGFKLTVGDKVISDTISRTHQLWNLLEYLIAFRHKTISQEELIAALWPNDDSENPANALKNLVYRIRSTFTSHGLPHAKEIITFYHGAYRWNNDLPCVVDTEEFERLCKEAANPVQPAGERIARYREALQLYRGDFLPTSGYEEWVVPLSSYYRSAYFKCVYECCELLMLSERYDDVRMICERANAIDPFEERAHLCLIHALVRQNKQSAALEHYNYVTDLFYRELGVKPSEAMRDLYREILKTVNSVETDLGIIKENLREHSQAQSAFYCDYEVFKNLYRLEARAAARTGQSIFIALFTLTDLRSNIPETKVLGTVMDQLLSTIRTSLRRGDVVSRFSTTQYVLMLPALTFENGQMVMDRITRRFWQEHKGAPVKIHTTLQPLDPVE